ADRPQRRRPLDHDLPEDEDERSRDVEAVGEKRAVAGVRALLRLHLADREDLVIGLSGEEVPATRSSVDEEALAAHMAPLDLGAARRRRARHQPSGLLPDPPERWDVVVGAEQDPGLARARLRRQIRFPLDEPMCPLGHPASHLGSAAVAHRPLEDGRGETVDLEEEEPWNLGALLLAGLPGDALDDAERVRVVVVQAEEDEERKVDRWRGAYCKQRPAEPIDADRTGCGPA